MISNTASYWIRMPSHSKVAPSMSFLDSSTRIDSCSQSQYDTSLCLDPLQSQGSFFDAGLSSCLSTATLNVLLSLTPQNSQTLFFPLDVSPPDVKTSAPSSETIKLESCMENDSSCPTMQRQRIFEDTPCTLQEYILEAFKRTPKFGSATQRPLHTLTETEESNVDEEGEGHVEDASITRATKRKVAGNDIVPSEHIKFGRGTGIYDWPGNIILRDLIKMRQEKYKSFGDTRTGKTFLSKEIIDILRTKGVYFWDRQKDSKEWHMLDYDTDSKRIREKVSSALRSRYDDTNYYRNKRERFEQKKKRESC